MTGGMFLPPARERTAGSLIGVMDPPAHLWIPLIQHESPACEPIVSVGDQVAPGQMIGRPPSGQGPAVHAPVAGRVVRHERVQTARRGLVPAVMVAVDRSATGSSAGAGEGRGPAVTPTTIEALATLVDEAGLTDFARPSRGLGQRLRLTAGRKVSDLIINGMDAEPMLSAHGALLRERLGELLPAMTLLRDLIGARRVWLAVEKRFAGECRKRATGEPARVVGLADRYPQANPILLVKTLLQRETPVRRSTLAVRAMVLELSAVDVLAGFLETGRPLTHRLLTVSGPSVARPGHYRVPIGTTLLHVLREVGLERSAWRVIDGGPLTGVAVESLDAVVTRETPAVLVLDHDSIRIPRPGPCVHCGWCQEDCPVGLDPQALLDLAERGKWAASASLHPFACIDCGLCSYVCPAELPLAEGLGRIKRELQRTERAVEMSVVISPAEGSR